MAIQTNLISLEQAQAQLNLSDCDSNTVQFLITAASSIIEKYCNRKFAQTEYDELYTVSGPTNYVFVNNPPIVKIESIRTNKTSAIQIMYKDSSNQTQQADVEVNSTGIILKKIYNNVYTEIDCPYLSYPTFATLSTFINSQPDWSTVLNPQFALWQTSDLCIYGTYNARNVTVLLPIYWTGLSNYSPDNEKGSIYASYFPRAYQSLRIKYIGGYANIPEEIQLACGTLVQATYLSFGQNPTLQSETILNYSYTRATEQTFAALGIAFKQTLNNYRLINVNQYQ